MRPITSKCIQYIVVLFTVLQICEPARAAIPVVRMESKDRLFHATISVPKGIRSVGFNIVDKTRNLDLGTYENLLSIYPKFKIYYSEEEVFQSDGSFRGDLSEEEQPVLIIRDKKNGRMFHAYTVFDGLGDIVFTLLYDGNQEIFTHRTTKDNDASDLIDLANLWTSEPPRPAKTLYYESVPRLDMRTPSDFVYIPSKEFNEELEITASKTVVGVGETVKLYAARKVSGFDRVAYETVDRDGCWESERPASVQRVNGNDLTWYLDPLGFESFKRGIEFCEVRFRTAGEYKITAESDYFCQPSPQKSSLTIRVVSGR